MARRAAVYPRVRGGTSLVSHPAAIWWGLSPRARGNLGPPVHFVSVEGSIPACAGEPGKLSTRPLPPRVYPRVRGGTDNAKNVSLYILGLSPRARGNLEANPPIAALVGSIPACAGEPCPSWRGYPPSGVYPRVRGGTALTFCHQRKLVGLSPRARGNLRISEEVYDLIGSIPACAGEPPGELPSLHRVGVYPRVRGGTPVVKFSSSIN